MGKIEVIDVMVASKLIKCGNEVILAGIPPEVIKAIKIKDLPFPTALLIPDRIRIATNLQNCTEFPLYHFLFASDALEKKKRLKIIGNSRKVRNNEKLLQMALFGLTTDELTKIGIQDEILKMFQTDSLYFRLKDMSGNLLETTDFLDNYSFDKQDTVSFNGITITRKAFNQYQVQYQGDEIIFDLNTNEKQIPPYYVQKDLTPNELCKFGIEILGGATGFSPTNASSGLIIVTNGNYLLVDSIPFLDHHLVARGVSKSQITSIFLTHIHDDHCNLLPLMLAVNRVKIITTKEIYWMAMFKLALMLDLPIKEINHYFDHVPVMAGNITEYYGVRIKPQYTVHSIPTIGATFYIQHNHLTHTVIISGDNQSLEDIFKMVQDKIISPTRAAQIETMYREKADLLIADGGEGMIHGTPRDALNSQADRIVFFHLDSLPPEFNATFSIASAGKRYVIAQGDTNFYLTKAIEFCTRLFKNIDPIWLSVLMGNMSMMRYNTEDVIIKQGAESRNKIYLILTGHCSIVIHDGKKPSEIARIEAGDLFGEMAITTGTKMRNASVIALSPVTVCEISEEVFHAFILKENIKQRLLENWDFREIFEKINFFQEFPNQVLDRLAQSAVTKKFNPDDKIDVQEHFYILIEGSVELRNDDDKIDLAFGDFFGNFGFKNLNFKQGQYQARDQVKCISYSTAMIKYVLLQTPLLLFAFRRKINSFHFID